MTTSSIVKNTIHEALVIELAPRGRKLQLLQQHVGFARFVWNWTLAKHRDNGWPIGGKAGLADRIAAVERKKKGDDTKLSKKISTAELSRQWTREGDDVAPWARLLIRNTVTYVIKAVDDAYKHAFRRLKTGDKAGWPRFRGRGHHHRGFTIQDQAFRHTRWAIRMGKIGMVPIRNARRHDQLDRLDQARVLRIVIRERAGRWFCALMVERPKPHYDKPGSPLVGMDLGYNITLSDGTVYEPPKPLARVLLWIRHWGRAMSRRSPKPGQPASKRYLKAKLILQRLHLRVTMIRKDWIHQTTTEIARKYTAVVTEGFDISRFVEHKVSHKDGRRTILDIGW